MRPELTAAGHVAALVVMEIDHGPCDYDHVLALVCECGHEEQLGDSPNPIAPFGAYVEHVASAEGVAAAMGALTSLLANLNHP